jgi:hypothetical protein
LLARRSDGACSFFDAAGGRLCAIHRDIGENALPSACRHFPRVTLNDPRGQWISLSHFCPTAARLLFVASPLRIVPAPDALSLSGQAEGLDATAALPPLLRPGMLMDFEGYGAWERSAVEMLAAAGPDASGALAMLQATTREVQGWSPNQGSLRARVERTMSDAPSSRAAEDLSEDMRLYALAVASVPAGLHVPNADDRIEPAAEIAALLKTFDPTIRCYLASKLFAGWWPYLGLDLMSVTEAIRVHAAALRINLRRRLRHQASGRDVVLEAIRDTDLLMVHLSDSRTLARVIAKSS